jgi:TolA-binding protein
VKKSAKRLVCVACLLHATAVFLVACSDAAPPPAKASGSSDTPLVIPPLADAGTASQNAILMEAEPTTIIANDTGGTSLIAARDPRLTNRRPQSRAHILGEVQSLERLLDASKKDAPDRPQLRRRIAEGYNDLAMTASGADADRARSESIKQYTAIVNDHPNVAQKDEVLYFLGLAHELNGDPPHARASYYELIKQSPNSKFIPLAYFAFGEIFYGEGVADPSKNDLALQAFIEVLKYPAPANPIVADTLLRIGQVHRRKGDTSKAKAMFTRLTREFPSSQAATQIPVLLP